MAGQTANTSTRQSRMPWRTRLFPVRSRDRVVGLNERRWTLVGALLTVAATLLAFAPLIVAFAVKMEISQASFNLIDPSVEGAPRAHGDAVTAMTVNEGSLVTSSYEGTIKFWNLKTGRLERTMSFAPAPGPMNAAGKPETAAVRRSAPLAFAIGADRKVIAMTDGGVAFEEESERLISAYGGKRDAKTGSSSEQPANHPAHDVAKANHAHHGIARNWVPHRRGMAPFVALALPGATETYAVGGADGSVSTESSKAKTENPYNPAAAAAPPAGWPRHSGAVTALAVKPDGGLLASVAEDGSVILWTLKDGRLAAARALSSIPVLTVGTTITGHTAEVKMAAFSPDGKFIATASADKTVRIWDVLAGKLIAVPLVGHDVLNIAFSRDGARIATTSDDNTVRIWNAATGKEVAILRGHAGRVLSARFSPDGRRIATASDDKTARIWDSASGKEISIPREHTDAVNAVAFSPDGTHLVTASSDRTARVWDVITGKQVALLRGHADRLFSATFSPDGARIATASLDRTARIWDAADGTLLTTLAGHAGTVFSAEFSWDGHLIVTASADKTARVWLSDSGSTLAVLSGHTDQVFGGAFSPDGAAIVTASEDRTGRLWPVGNSISTAVASRCTLCASVAFSAESNRLITAGGSGAFQIWNTDSGELIRTLHQDAAINVARLTADGAIAITGGDDGAARLWDVNSGAEIATIRGHGDAIVQAELTPDRARIVTGARDGSVRLTRFAEATALNYVDPVRLYRQYVLASIGATSHFIRHFAKSMTEGQKEAISYSFFSNPVPTEPPPAAEPPKPAVAALPVQTAPPAEPARPRDGGKRVALVIGNSAYQHAPALRTPVSDARAMVAMFEKGDFSVITAQYDGGNIQFKRTIRQFEDAAADADIAVIYYAGHGLELHGINYLIPVDAKLASDRDADDEAITLDRLVEAGDGAKRLRLVLLDACRDNPFARTMRRQRTQPLRAITAGLGKAEPTSSNTLIAYAAKGGAAAEDGDGDHSHYTAALLNHLFVPGLDVRLALGRVRDEVLKKTANRQEPYVYGSLGGASISLVPAPEKNPAAVAAVSEGEKGDYELVEKIGTKGAWEVFLAQHPKGFYADLAREQLTKLAMAEAASGTAARSPPQQQKAAVEPPKAPKTVGPSSEEQREWDKIKNSSNAELFREFIRRYPASRLADTAVAHLEAIEAATRERERLVAEREQKARLEAQRKEEARRQAEQEAAFKRAREEARAAEEARAKAEREAARKREEEGRQRQLAEALPPEQAAEVEAKPLKVERAERAAEAVRARAEREAALKREEEERQRKVVEVEQAAREACRREEDRFLAVYATGAQAVGELQKFEQELTCARLRPLVVAALNRLIAAQGVTGSDRVRAAQTELVRLGCYGGTVDGSMGEGTKAAVERYLAQQRRTGNPAEITEALLSELKSQRGRVCLLACPPGQIAEGEKCVAAKKSPPVRSRKD